MFDSGETAWDMRQAHADWRGIQQAEFRLDGAAQKVLIRPREARILRTGLPGFREAASFITPAGYSGMGCDDGLRGTRTTFLVGPVPILGVSPTFLE